MIPQSSSSIVGRKHPNTPQAQCQQPGSLIGREVSHLLPYTIANIVAQYAIEHLHDVVTPQVPISTESSWQKLWRFLAVWSQISALPPRNINSVLKTLHTQKADSAGSQGKGM